MKYSEDVIQVIETSIKNLSGRVNATKDAGISYETFTVWMATKPEFSERIKKAEETARQTGHDTAVLSIFNAMPKQWQAGAWWLERTFPETYKERKAQDNTGEITVALVEYVDNKPDNSLPEHPVT